MRILVIHGSMRKGNTYTLTKEVVSCLYKKQDVEITEYSVADLDLPFCCSCHLCFSKGEENCPHYGRLRNIKDALLDSDGVILSGTTYIRSLNAAMKNLLDHFAYLFHRPALFGKRGMVITTSAGVGEKRVAKYIKTVMGQWGINGAKIVTQNIKAHKLQSNGAELSIKEIAKLDNTAEKFYSLIKSKRHIPPSLKNIAVHNAFRAMSLSDFSESECDTQFWRTEGFRNKAYPVKAGAFRYLVGAFIYGVAQYSTKVIGKMYIKRQKE